MGRGKSDETCRSERSPQHATPVDETLGHAEMIRQVRPT